MDRCVTPMANVSVGRTLVDSSVETVPPVSINILNVFPVPAITEALMVCRVIMPVDVFAKINSKVFSPIFQYNNNDMIF